MKKVTLLILPALLWTSLFTAQAQAQAPAAPAAPAAAPAGPTPAPAAAAPVSSGPVDRLVAKDGKEIPWTDVVMTGTSIAWTTKNPSTGGDMVVNLTPPDILRLEFAEPPQLQEALIALSRNEVDKAVALAKPVVDQFSPFKTTPGTWYPAASMIQLEALAINKDPGYDKLRADIKTINLNSTDEARLDSVEASADFVKGILGPALTRVDGLLAKVDDGSILAKLYLLRGHIQFKRGNFNDALEAYLHVPVFYGAQSAYLPNAELGAARSLQKMGKLEDAVESYRSLKERYKDMPQAGEADKELTAITKALGSAADAEAAEAKAEEPKEPKSAEKPAANAEKPAADDKPMKEAPPEDAPKGDNK